MAAWIDRVARLISLARRGVIVQVDRACDVHLPALLRRLEADGPVQVCVDPDGLWAAPEGATVVFAPSPHHVASLNASRPRVASRRLRIVLWCGEDMSAALLRGAPDFFDWISHRVECPDGALPPFLLAGMEAARRAKVGGAVVEGDDDFEHTLEAHLDEDAWRCVAWNRDAMRVEVFRARGAEGRPHWVVDPRGDGATSIEVLRVALALQGLDETVFVEGRRGAGSHSPGWWTLDRTWTPLATAAATARALAPKTPLDALARCGGERGAIDLLLALLEHGDSPRVIARGMRGCEDGGAWLARRAHRRGLVTVEEVALGTATPPALRALWSLPAVRLAARGMRAKVATALTRGEQVPYDLLGWFASHRGLPPLEVATAPDDETTALFLLEAFLHANPEGAAPPSALLHGCVLHLPRMLVERLMTRWHRAMPEADASRLLLDAAREESTGDLDRASDLYKGVCDFVRVHRRSELARAVIALARLHRLRGAYDEAHAELDDLEKGGEHTQDLVAFYAERARLSIALHRPGDAQLALEALSRGGGPAEVRQTLRREMQAAVFLLDGRHGEALKLLRDEALLPVPLRLLRADALLMAGSSVRALEVASGALAQAAPDGLLWAEARMLEAHAWIELGGYAQAMSRCDEVGHLWTRRSLRSPLLWGRWHRVRGEALLRMGSHEEAHEAFDLAVRYFESRLALRDHPELLEARLAGCAVPGYGTPAEVDAAWSALRKRLRSSHPLVAGWTRRVAGRLRAAG